MATINTDEDWVGEWILGVGNPGGIGDSNQFHEFGVDGGIVRMTLADGTVVCDAMKVSGVYESTMMTETLHPLQDGLYNLHCFSILPSSAGKGIFIQVENGKAKKIVK